MKYVKKPVEIEAVQFIDDPDELIGIQSFMGDIPLNIDYSDPNDPKLKIPTLEGVMEASLGDYIIKGVKGEYYPCKPDIFDMTYKMIPNITIPDTFSFGLAVTQLKFGKKVARQGWNGKGMYLVLVHGYPVNGHLYPAHPHKPIPQTNPDGTPNITQGNPGQMLSHVVMKTAGESQHWGEGYSDYVPWLASQTDILAEDWVIVD